VIVLARKGGEGLLQAPRTENEHLWLCVWAKCHLEICTILRKYIWTTGCK